MTNARKAKRETAVPHKLPSPEERWAQGRALRDKDPRTAHAEWHPPKDRPDPIDIIIASNKGREPSLVPIRHGRMLASPFAFLRGSAAVMAWDLAHTPATGLRVQACGDCHLMNFGVFATPERNLVFDINDFDETLPAPWEWDVKRLAASIAVAGRYIGLRDPDCFRAARAAIASYRDRMSVYAETRVFDVWYEHLDVNNLLETISDPRRQRTARTRIDKLRQQSSAEHDYPKMVEEKRNGVRLLRNNPPLIFHPVGTRGKEFRQAVDHALLHYRETLPEQYAVLFDRFRLHDVAMKVVGVGSVGTYCGVGLFMASDGDPLFLQVKQANASVLEPYAGASKHDNHGHRVVAGQRLMQSASDILLGWTKGDLNGRHFYLRQLRDMKLSAVVETMDRKFLTQYAASCGWALARAHARSGDPAAIAGYIGKSDTFLDAIANFALAYANQTDADHKALVAAVRDGRLEAVTE